MKRSQHLFETARHYMPGGVNSPVRAFRAVNATPPFIERARGSKIYDADGREYIDYVSSWGPLILGHAREEVVAAICGAARDGATFGAPTEREIEMSRFIVEAFPSIDMVRMVSSGTEAAMSAIRLARGVTGRDRIIKFDGCYHGHVDSLLVEAGSGVATFAIPGTPGIPNALAELTISLPYNDGEAFRNIIEEEGHNIACVIVEPVAGNMGVVPPLPGFLEIVRTLTNAKGIVLIFDEVITGFRICYGGYQHIAGIEPDLTCLGKIIGGGLPVGAFGGRRDIMERLAPEGPVYQAGTLSGNPVAMAAGLATLEILKSADYEGLNARAEMLFSGMKDALLKKGFSHRMHSMGSMGTLFFTDHDVSDYLSAKKSDTKRYADFFLSMLEGGIYLAPSQFESMFVSFAHEEEDILATLDVFQRWLNRI